MLKSLNINLHASELMPLLLPRTELNGLPSDQRKQILTLREIIKMYMTYIPETNHISVKNSVDVVKYIHPLLKGKKQEELWLILLDRANHITHINPVSIGGLDQTVIDNKIILKKALADSSSAIIIVHNHPSGSTKPGKNDIKLTEDLKKACKLLDILLLDHIIIADDSFYSFADEETKKIKF